MKIVTETREIVRSGNFVESNFKIDANAKAFKILSDGLYSDKVLAIVRELSCNAYDSHIAAGKHDTPIEVRLPSELDPTFYVKDFGLGLSDFQVRGGWIHLTTLEELELEDGMKRWNNDDVLAFEDGFERVGGLYTTYFRSTKTDSNEFIGALGLGSKSPFSYTSSFTVESRFNGIVSVYTAMLNENEEPTIIRLGQQKTDECNGVTVSLAVNRKDIHNFTTAAQSAFTYFVPRPNVIGSKEYRERPLPNIERTGSNWSIRSRELNYHVRGVQIIQGVVAYPLDASLIGQSSISKEAWSLIYENIDIFVDVGQVDVSASRESLSYNKTTIANIISVVEKIADEYVDVIQQKIDELKTVWEAKLFFIRERSSSHMFNNMSKTRSFTFKGKPINDIVDVSTKNLKKTRVHTLRRTSYSHAKLRLTTDYDSKGLSQLSDKISIVLSYNRNDSCPIVVIDDANSRVRIRKLVEKNPNSVHIIISGITKRDYDEKEIKRVVKEIGNPPVVYTSSVVIDSADKTPSGYYKAKKINEVLTWKDFYVGHNKRKSYSFSRMCWNNDTVDFNNGGVYVPIFRFDVKEERYNTLKLTELIFVMKQLKLIDDKQVIYGLTEKQLEKIDNKKWKNLFDIFEEYVKKNVDDLSQYIIDAHVAANVDSRSVVQRFVNNEVIDRLVDSPFKRYCEELQTYVECADKLNKKNNVNIDMSMYNVLVNLATYPSPSNRKSKAFLKFVEAHNKQSIVRNKVEEKRKIIFDQYPMLGLLDWYTVNEDSVDIVIDYVNLRSKDINKNQ